MNEFWGMVAFFVVTAAISWLAGKLGIMDTNETYGYIKEDEK